MALDIVYDVDDGVALWYLRNIAENHTESESGRERERERQGVGNAATLRIRNISAFWNATRFADAPSIFLGRFLTPYLYR